MNLMDKDEALATKNALEAYVDYFKELHGENCKLHANNLFTIQFLVSNLIEMLVLGNKDYHKGISQVNAAIASAEVKVLGEAK